jgi:hypothetical protein
MIALLNTLLPSTGLRVVRSEAEVKAELKGLRARQLKQVWPELCAHQEVFSATS